MRVLKKEAGKPVEVCEIDNTLEALQEAVGGHIETVTMFSTSTIICDEEGFINGKPYNFNFLGVDFFGTVLMVGVKGDKFCDVPKDAIRLFSKGGHIK